MRDEDDSDWDDDEDDGSASCPYCGASYYEESGYCGACERWISREDQPQRTLPRWMTVVIVLCLISLILGALRAF